MALDRLPDRKRKRFLALLEMTIRESLMSPNHQSLEASDP